MGCRNVGGSILEAIGRVQGSLQTFKRADHQGGNREKRDPLYKSAAPSQMLPGRQLPPTLSPGTELVAGSPLSPFPGVQNLEGKERNLSALSCYDL